jgi:hypothetical protein
VSSEERKVVPCKPKRVECLRKMNSSCNSYEGEWFPSAQSRFAGVQVPDRKLDNGHRSVRKNFIL